MASETPKSVEGFTLLEMLVVIMLVSLLAGMLMQGFLYAARVSGIVERRQSSDQFQQLLQGWVSDSVSGLTNGFDGISNEQEIFSGDEFQFRGVSTYSLVSFNQGVPVRVWWDISRDDKGTVVLRYAEASFDKAEYTWTELAIWSGASARWLYRYKDAWVENFPERTGYAAEGSKDLLPDAVALEVLSGRQSVRLISAIRAVKTKMKHPNRDDG